MYFCVVKVCGGAVPQWDSKIRMCCCMGITFAVSPHNTVFLQRLLMMSDFVAK